jgi:VWFA-related protein
MNTAPPQSLVVMVALAVAGAVSHPQDPRVQQLVPIYVTAHDSGGVEVDNLSADELSVRVDGKPVTIGSVSRESHHVSMIVLLDTSVSLSPRSQPMRLVAMGFLSQVRPLDRARVGGFNEAIHFSDRFVSDQDELMSAVGTLKGGNPTKLHDAMLASADLLKDEPGRRAIVVLSDGADTASKASFRDAIDILQSHQIAVYTVGVEAVFHSGTRVVRSRPHKDLMRYADETGGEYFELKSGIDLKAQVLRTIQQMRSSYVIMFAPTAADGRHHQLLVRSSRGGVTIRAAKGYLARP